MAEVAAVTVSCPARARVFCRTSLDTHRALAKKAYAFSCCELISRDLADECCRCGDHDDNEHDEIDQHDEEDNVDSEHNENADEQNDDDDGTCCVVTERKE